MNSLALMDVELAQADINVMERDTAMTIPTKTTMNAKWVRFL